MNPKLQKLASDWKTYVALVAATGTAISTLSATVSGVADTVKVFKNLPPEALWILAAVFLVIAIIALASALSRHSILREPQRFLLSPENPQHLVGREEEVEKLARQCGRHAMVFLTGDSGSGKSALVRAGLAPALLSKDGPAGQELVPLVIDLSGVRWERGLSVALARGLGRLPDDAWLALGGGDRPAVENLFLWMGNRPPHSPRRLIVVFDQFDDYLAAHRPQFYDGTTLRRPTEIEEHSPDWHGLAELLRSGAVSLLVVARSEASASLPALGFVEEARIAREHLTRLPGNLVAPLLSRLTEPLEEGHPVVEDPELGWLQLRSRLLRDLEASGEGQILPIQLSVALNSLRLLRSLTTAEYERIGGLRGLERLHVERHAKTAAEASGVPTGAVLEALLTMVSPDGSKTRPAARGDFDGVLSRHGAANDASERAVRQLEDDKLLRRIPREEDEPETLLLYHDYLARGAREAYRQANRWTELLRERAQIFQESVSWRQRWRALLSPSEQTRLLWERIRGRFSFNDRRRFFGLSTLRWAPIVLVLLALGAGGWAAERYRKYEIAAEVMKAIGHGGMTREEAQELRRLSAAGPIAVTRAFRLAGEDGATAARALTRVEQMVSMAIGLDPTRERSSALAEGLVVPTLENDRADSEAAIFAAAVASKLRLTPSAAKQIASFIVSRMKTETDSEALFRLGSALGSFSASLERQDIAPLAERLLSRMKTETDPGALSRLGSALASLSAKLERQDIAPGAELLVARMTTETDRDALFSLGLGLGSLSTKLERQDIAPGAELLVARMTTETDSEALSSLGWALGSLSAKLERQDVAPGAELLVARMTTETDRDALFSLTWAFGPLSAKLERQDIAHGAELLVARMTTETNPDLLSRLGWALGALGAKPERQDIASLAERLVARMKTETDSVALTNLGWALGSLSATLERQDIVPGAERLVARMKTETDPDALVRLGSALGSLSSKLKRRDVAPAFDVLVTTAYRAWKPITIPMLTGAVVALGPSMPNPVSLSAYPHPVRVEQIYVDLLKSPFIVDHAREELLKGLEKATGQSFSGDLWSFVDWATKTPEGRALGLDLDGPPPWRAEPLAP